MLPPTFVKRNLSLLGLAFISALTFFDVLHDLSENLPITHILHELALFFISLGILYFQLSLVKKKEGQIALIKKELASTLAEREAFHQQIKHIKESFHGAVQKQFASWELGAGEKDVALLLIKGMSMKEIADARGTKEATIRQQATSIYKKSGLNGRQQLAAFFLEDLFPAEASAS